MRARICHSLRVHFFLRFYVFIQSVACETCIEVLITAAATAIVVANGFAANASACSSTHRQEIGGGYFVFFIVFFFLLFYFTSVTRDEAHENRGKMHATTMWNL